MKDTWSLERKNNGKYIIHNKVYGDLPSVEGIDRYDSVSLLIPVSESFSFALVERKSRGNFIMIFFVDIRFVKDKNKWISSSRFHIKGPGPKVDAFRKSIDDSRNATTNCMGLSYFIRKLFFGGWSTFQIPVMRN